MPGDWNFATCWEAIADARPDAPALIQGERRVTWAEFEDRSSRLAGAFADLGLGPDAKVASYLYNCPEYLEGTFATWKVRAAPVNVNYRYLEEELLYLLENSDAEVLLFHGVLGEHVAKVRDRAPKLRVVVQVDDGSPLLDGAIAYEDLVDAHEPAERIEPLGRRLLHPLHGWHHRHAEGRDVAQRRPLHHAHAHGARSGRRVAARQPGGLRPRRRSASPTRAGPRCISRRRRSCTAPASSARSKR